MYEEENVKKRNGGIISGERGNFSVGFGNSSQSQTAKPDSCSSPDSYTLSGLFSGVMWFFV